jgi:ribosomal protein L12E/L44/L45/RPP1/RPP2
MEAKGMAIDETTIQAIQKSLEGTNLALAAISEVLSKSDESASRLGTFVEKLLAKADKEDEDEQKEKEEAEEEESFAKLVKALQIVGFVTKDQMSLEHSGADTDEKKIPVKSVPSEQQDVIQGAEAMEKSITQPENLPKKSGALKKGDEEDKDEKDEKGKEDEYPEVEKLKKDLAAAQAQIVDLQKSQTGQIQTAIEDVLGKMGYHREKKSFQVTPTQIGADPNKLQKSEEATDRVGQMSKLSYGDLRKLQMAEEAGQLPDDVRKLIG